MLEPLTLYKLMILYMLNKVTFPLTNSQLSSFFLEKEYTTYFTFQQAVAELIEQNLVTIESIRNTSYNRITMDGRETLSYFAKKLPVAVIDDMDIYLANNQYEFRNEVGTISDYYKTTEGDYTVHCEIKEGRTILIELNISVPTEKDAENMCNNWKENCQDLYANILHTLSKSSTSH